MSAPNDKNAPEALPFATFLEEVPPGSERAISDLLVPDRRRAAAGLPPIWRVNTPDIRLHCSTETCGGVLFFKNTDDSVRFDSAGSETVFLFYECRNCRMSCKRYALLIKWDELGDLKSGSAVKYGEIPPFGPPLSKRMLKMAGADEHLLQKGRRAESQSLGIGAFAYYRRVVENQKDRLLGEIRKAAERLGADETLLASIDRAKGETQFSKSLDLVKDAIPDRLKVQGQNPLKLLHGALSKGVHGLDDKECLEQAQAVRVVLNELVSNVEQILKKDSDVKAAVKRLQSKT